MSAKQDELLVEFQSLINQVGAAVVKESVLPAVQQLTNEWAAQTKKLEMQFEESLSNLGVASRSIANTLETHGCQLRNDMAADTQKWEAAVGQHSEALTKGLEIANGEVASLSRNLEQLATQLTGAWESAATSLSDSCDRFLSNSDVPAQLQVFNEHVARAQAATEQMRQATATAVEALENWQSQMSGVLRTVESRLPSLTGEIGELNEALRSGQRLAEEVRRSNAETAKAMREYGTLTRKSVELTEVMAKTLSKQLLEMQGGLRALGTDTRSLAQQAQQEREEHEVAMQRRIATLHSSVDEELAGHKKEMRKQFQAVLATEEETRSALTSLLEAHDQRLQATQAAHAHLIGRAHDELWRKTCRALGWLAALIVATSSTVGWLLLR